MMYRMRPPVFWASICGTTYLTASQHPFRFTSSIMSHHSSVMSPRQGHISDACIADQDIDVPEHLDGFLDGRLHVPGATYISLDTQDPPPQFRDLPDRLTQIIRRG